MKKRIKAFSRKKQIRHAGHRRHPRQGTCPKVAASFPNSPPEDGPHLARVLGGSHAIETAALRDPLARKQAEEDFRLEEAKYNPEE